MAEIAVSFAVEKMGDLIIQKAIFLGGVHDQVDRLKAELRRMECFLKDADARQHENERVRNWVSEIRDLAYQAEDAIDLYISSVAIPENTEFFPCRIFKKLRNCNKMGKQIEGIQMKVKDIRKSLVTYGIKSIGEATTSVGQMLKNLRYISPFVTENIVVGLQEETDEIVKQLVGGDERRRVVSIVGMGGIGKTTLAKKAYNDRRVLDQFPSYRAWVYVSEDCRPRDVFQQILNRLPYTPTDAERSKIEKFQENELGDFLHEYLRGKRYLVVLDDIWKSEDWKCVARAFPEESNGSRLLLTTRNTEVALQADAWSAPHLMRVLSDQKSWKLFCRTAIPQEDGDTDTCPPVLQEMGEKMVKKCGGLPLAIVVLGGLLSSKPRSPIVWETVLNNLQAHFACKNGVDAVLSLSYLDLPHNLKSCFLYMGLFPEDSVIPKRRLLRLWMAEGFVPQQEEEDGYRRESRAEEYLNELINRNLVQAARMSMNERVTKCRIHDLIRDLCIKKAKDLNFFRMGSTSLPKSSRRLAVYREDMDWYASTEPSTPYIRSLLFFNLKWSTFTVSHKHFKLLRVLDLRNVRLTIESIRFRNLIHLRYLRLPEIYVGNSSPSWSDLLYLPTSLQTLTMESYLPFADIKKMENLRHLSLSRISSLEQMEPVRIENLRNLQTLYWITLRHWLQNDTSKLTSLRKLKIEGRISEEEAGQLSKSITKCKNLRSLCLDTKCENENLPLFGLSTPSDSRIPFVAMNSWRQLTKLEMRGHIKQLPEVHELPPNLTQLTLNGTRLGNEAIVILQKLPKLSALRLRGSAFRGEVKVLKDGFPQLTNLILDSETRFHIDKGGMPKLTQVQIYTSSGVIDVMPILSNSSQWHELRRKDEGGKAMRSFVRK